MQLGGSAAAGGVLARCRFAAESLCARDLLALRGDVDLSVGGPYPGGLDLGGRCVARSIVVSWEGKESSFGYAKLDRGKLYATRKRLPLDPQGNVCKRAELSDDGSMLVVSGMTGQGYFDETGRWIPNKELVGLDRDGNEVPLRPSTLGQAQALAEVEPELLLDAAIGGVYMLDAEEVDDDLTKALDDGKIFRFDFNTRADYHMETAYLVANEHGTFVLLGDTMDVPWCVLDQPSVMIDDDDDDAELDFEMF
jgi:hypothetical protein